MTDAPDRDAVRNPRPAASYDVREDAPGATYDVVDPTHDPAFGSPERHDIRDTRQDEAVATALRAGLAEFELEEDDRVLLDGADLPATGPDDEAAVPVVAVIGRPNVGKSTLVNRIIGRREAVVEDVPGVTRDRVAYDAEWVGRRFTLVDTGGWEVGRRRGSTCASPSRPRSRSTWPTSCCSSSTRTVGATDTDEAVVQLLRRSGKPVVLVANKVDDQRGEADAAALWSLGLGEPYPVSALHGRGSGDAARRRARGAARGRPAASAYRRGGPRRVALRRPAERRQVQPAQQARRR